MLGAHGQACIKLAKELSAKIGVPYYDNRITERFLGHRLKNPPGDKTEHPLLDTPRFKFKGVVSDTWPMDPATGAAAAMEDVESLTEEAWSRDYWPNTADDVLTAFKRLPDGAIEGMYYHGPSMCLVLLHPGGPKVGIRAPALINPRTGLDKATIALLGKLKKAK
jgi:hypothetical protein